ncbi:unnamed protein product [Musa acuminata subsp. burmannicoides]
MESAATAVSVGASGPGYPDSADSSPRSRGGDSWDEPFPPSAAAASSRLRLMCSYGGRIVPRPTDKSLCYLGGETRMVVVDRHSSLADISAKLSRKLLGGRPFSLKYQLPNEDLDSLISVTTDEDLENMIDELDRISAATAAAASGGGGSTRSSRLRLFLFPSKSESAPSSTIGSLLDESKSETWFVDALNSAIGGMSMDGLPRGHSADSATVDSLLGLEDNSSVHSRKGGGGGGAASHPEPEQLVLPRPDSAGKLARHGQDVHSVPDSPMLDTTSSFGSTSSAPSLSNLPPIPVPTDDRYADHRISGLDDHLAHMNLSSDSATSQRPDDGFKEPIYAHHLQVPPPIPIPTASDSIPTISASDNSNRVFSDDEKSDHGVRKPPQPPKPTQVDAPSSDPASRYHHSATYLNLNSDPNVSFDRSYRAPLPPVDAPGFVLSSVHPEQLQQQQTHSQFHQQQPQFISTNPHYIHHTGAGTGVPMASYYSIVPQSMQQLPQAHPFDSHIPMYYVPVRQTTPYPYAGTGYHVMQHPHLSQSPATMANYGYEVTAAPGHPQMYYSQASSQPALSRQYQMASSTAVIPEAGAPGDSNTSKTS